MKQPRRCHPIYATNSPKSTVAPARPVNFCDALRNFTPAVKSKKRVWSGVGWILALSLLIPLPATPNCRADISESEFQKDLQTLASFPTRVVGSDGYYAAA